MNDKFTPAPKTDIKISKGMQVVIILLCLSAIVLQLFSNFNWFISYESDFDYYDVDNKFFKAYDMSFGFNAWNSDNLFAFDGLFQYPYSTGFELSEENLADYSPQYSESDKREVASALIIILEFVPQLILNTLPCVLLLAYVAFMQRKQGPKELIRLVCIILAITPLFDMVFNITSFVHFDNWLNTVQHYIDAGTLFGYPGRPLYLAKLISSVGLLFGFVATIGFLLYAVNAHKNFSGIVLPSIGILCAFFVLGFANIALLLRIWYYIVTEQYLYIFTNFAEIMGKASLYIALLVYSLSYRKAVIKAAKTA